MISAPTLPGLSIFHPAGFLSSTKSNPFGKDLANTALFRALAQHGGYQHLSVLHQTTATSQELLDEFHPSVPASFQLLEGTLWNTDLPARAGVLLRGQPYLAELAWLRRGANLQSSYSLAGVIHTLAPPFVREQIASCFLAPVHHWDALVCTSPSVQEVMYDLIEQHSIYLQDRFGVCDMPRPQISLIPLGVDVAKIFAQRNDIHARVTLRTRLDIPENELLVLWVGRLSFYEKAFPQAMFQALESAAAITGQKLHFALVGWFPNPESDLRLFQQAAARLSQNIKVTFLDGNDPHILAQSWAAADLFLSLVDNIQETFGLAPVEAMAAGLPVVVSDWDGFRYTVRHGVEGYLIPTLGSPNGLPGELLAQLHMLGLETYQTYVGSVAQHTAVHLGRASDALVALIRSPEMRTTMGAAGLARTKQMFDWPVIVDQYNHLFSELSSRRTFTPPKCQASITPTSQPTPGDPFNVFRFFPTTVLEPCLRLRLAPGVKPADLYQLSQIDLNRLYPGLRASLAEACALLQMLESVGSDGSTAGRLLDTAPPERRAFFATTLVWLAKLGLVDWL